jgi:hypothetical protein
MPAGDMHVLPRMLGTLLSIRLIAPKGARLIRSELLARGETTEGNSDCCDDATMGYFIRELSADKLQSGVAKMRRVHSEFW